jgi:hypothetical protein
MLTDWGAGHGAMDPHLPPDIHLWDTLPNRHGPRGTDLASLASRPFTLPQANQKVRLDG